MKIDSIKITNYRGLELEISKFSMKNQIIGKNDSGKTTLLSAIQKIMDISYRNKDFTITDSTDNNCNDIILEAILIFESEKEYSKEFLTSVLSNVDLINKEPDGKIDDITNLKISIEVRGIYNEKREQYDTIVKCNNKIIKGKLPIDDFITLIYLNPVYSYEESLKKYFRAKKRNDQKNKVPVDPQITEAINNLNSIIQNSDSFKQLQSELNTNSLNHKTRKIESSVPIDDIYSGLSVNEYNEDKRVAYFGDGNRRIFSNDLEIARAKMNNKEITITLIEEPENHLFIDKQRDYIEELSKNSGQIIVTTHSPYIVNFAKEYSIIKLDDNYNNYSFINTVENDFGYFYNEKMSELFYYDNILLVEGYSEELFYDYISQIPEIKQIIKDKNLGIFNIKGIGFDKYLNSFNQLGIKTFIKTDNDFVKKKNNMFYFSGINRGIKYLKSKDDFITDYHECFPNHEILEIGNNTTKSKEFTSKKVTPNMKQELDWVVNYFAQSNIYLSKHNSGFEGDLKELVPTVDQEKLTQAKHENLYAYLNSNKTELVEAIQYNLNNNIKENKLLSVFFDLKGDNESRQTYKTTR